VRPLRVTRVCGQLAPARPRRRPGTGQATARPVQWVLENEAYLGKVHWRGQSYPGLHKPLVDQAPGQR